MVWRAVAGSGRRASPMAPRTLRERRSGFGDEADKAALALDERGQVALPWARRKISRSASQCPMAWRSPISAGRWAMVRSSRDLEAARLAAEALPPQPPGPEQMAVQLQRPSFRAVDELVDGLVAQAAILASDLQATGDLLGRPPELQLLDDMAAQVRVPDQLALPAATAPGAVLGGDRGNSRGTVSPRGTRCGRSRGRWWSGGGRAGLRSP